MDDDLIQRSSSASRNFSSYHCGSVSRGLNAGTTTFLVPEDGDDGRDAGDGALARYYDLARHLSEDFEAGSGTGAEKGRNGKVSADSPDSVTAQTASTTDGITSSRLITGLPATLPATAANAVENVAAATLPKAANRTVPTATASGNKLHAAATKELATISIFSGTAPANITADMPRQNDSTRSIPSSSGTGGLVGRIRFTGCSNGQESSSGREDPRRDERTSTAGALAIASADVAPGSASGQMRQTPSMQNVSQAILDEMERMRQDGASSVSLSIGMPDGSKLDIRLRWRGSHLKASFGGDAEACRSDIENGWANLSLRAGNHGMTLEPPSFEGGTPESVESSLYA